MEVGGNYTYVSEGTYTAGGGMAGRRETRAYRSAPNVIRSDTGVIES